MPILGETPGMLVVDGRDAIEALDLSGDAPVRVLLTSDGVPCALVDLPRLGPGPHRGIAEAALVPHLELAQVEQRLRAELRDRLGAPEPPRLDLTSSVVICTRGRRRVLEPLLESVHGLDPAPDEVIVVDNDPTGDDCRREAGRFGARYVPERRRGLNNARRTGMHAARGDVVALTDDDCVLQPGWLASLSERFADPMVAAVTGPAFPYELGTEVQELRERAAPYLQSLTARTFDWTTTSVVRTGTVGFGANMILRRSVLPELGELFPPELDAGTLTQSGGDLYALHRVLAAGYRVCFEPAAFLLHRHGESGESAEQTAESWGRGFFAFLSRAVMRDGELAALPYATLPIRACVESLLDVLQGTGDPPVLRMRWRYLRSALGGPRAWIHARGAAYEGRANRGVVHPLQAGDRVAPARAKDSGARRSRGAGPALSVVVPALLNPASTRVHLRELASRQSLEDRWEAIVVSPFPNSDGPRESADGAPSDSDDFSVRLVRAGGGWAECANAGVAAARGEFVLLLDPLMEWDEDLLAAHLHEHRAADSDTAVIGYSPLWPANRRLAALAERLRSEDGFRMTAESAALTFVDVRASNLSMAASAFARVGGFDSRIPEARLGWDWGARALRSGLRIAYVPEAAAPRRGWVGPATYVEDAALEGRADALLVARHPELATCLPGPVEPRRRVGRISQRLAAPVLRRGGPRAAAARLLEPLEAMRLRRAWLWLATAARRGAYEDGWRVTARDPAEARMRSVRVVDLDSSAPVSPPEVGAPAEIELRMRGRPFARTRPRGGHWRFAAIDEALRQDHGWRRAAAAVAPEHRPPADAAGMEVMFGPGRRSGDTRNRDAFEAAGASVRIVGDVLPATRAAVGGREHWAALDGPLREPGPSIVGLPLPGMSPEPRWLAAASEGLDVDRLAAVIGAGLQDSALPGPLHLFGRDSRNLPYEYGVRPAQFIVFRRALYQELGGFDPDAAVAGPLAPVLDFVERALEAGSIVGYRETPGISPGDHRGIAFARSRWWRATAHGGLLTRRAITIGGVRGAVWFGRRALLPRVRDLGRALTRADRSAMGWVSSTAGFATGCSRAFAASRRGRGA